MMKKIFLLVSFLLCLNAEELSIQDTKTKLDTQSTQKDSKTGNFIVGIFGGFNTLTTENEYFKDFTELEGLDNSKNSIGLSYGIKAGYDFIIKPQHNLRLYLDYSGNNFFDKSSGKAYVNAILINLDYKYNFTDFVNFFIGLNANSVFLNTNYFEQQTSFGAGVNIGFILNLLPYLELETRMRFISDSFKEKNISVDSKGLQAGANIQKIDFSDLLNLSVGLNFKF